MTWEGLTPPYSTIVADPPWQYRRTEVRWSRSPQINRAVGARYTAMTMADIAALPVKQLAAPDAHLYLWATNPLLFDGPAEIMQAWGFRFVTLLTWVKTGPVGMGFYFRGATEHVLFGIRGTCPIPSGLRESNVITAPRGHHSAKPPAFLDLVERVSPGPFVELFARQPRLGWDSWGHGYEQVGA